MLPGTVLVDGRVAAMWSVERAKGAATLVVTPLRPLAGADREAIGGEGARLLALTAAEAHDHDVRIVEPDT